MPHETAAISARSVYTIQPCTMSLHAKPHTWGACVFSCNLPPALLAEWLGSFTRYCGNTGWNGYRNKSQLRQLTLDNKKKKKKRKKKTPFLPGLEPATSQSLVRRSNHWAIPDPQNTCFVQDQHGLGPSSEQLFSAGNGQIFDVVVLANEVSWIRQGYLLFFWRDKIILYYTRIKYYLILSLKKINR